MSNQATNKSAGISPADPVLARAGWYCGGVARVVNKWRPRMEIKQIEDYFLQISRAMLGDMPLNLIHSQHLPALPRGHWQLVAELIGALAAVLQDESNPQSWILSPWFFVVKNGQDLTWQERADEIVRRSGQRFTPNALKTAAHRIGLLEGAGDRAEFLKRKPKYIPRRFRVRMVPVKKLRIKGALTPRQRTVLDAERSGKSQKEIATMLGIDQSVVARHLKVARRKGAT